MKKKFKHKTKVNKQSIIENSNFVSVKLKTCKETRLPGSKGQVETDREVGNECINQKRSESRSAVSINFSRMIPPRVPFNSITESCYKICEKKIFDYWKCKQKQVPYEKNLEAWRQLWLTCERADVIAQILDSRNPEFFFIKDLVDVYSEKKHVLLINKIDLVHEETWILQNNSSNAKMVFKTPKVCSEDLQENYSKAKSFVLQKNSFLEEYEHVFYSSIDTKSPLKDFIQRFKHKKIAFIGYPNVGKSSTINQILEGKRVQISETPGKTKHLQSIFFGELMLLDCPGIVFPRHEKFDLIVNGIINVDQILDYSIYFQKLIDFVGEDNIRKKYSIKGDILQEIYNKDGSNMGQIFKKIVKDYIRGFL